MSATIPPLPNTPSWCAQGELYLRKTVNSSCWTKARLRERDERFEEGACSTHEGEEKCTA